MSRQKQTLASWKHAVLMYSLPRPRPVAAGISLHATS